MMKNFNQSEIIENINVSNWLLPIKSDNDGSNFLTVIENYVDDYCTLELEHLIRGIIHGIDLIFSQWNFKEKTNQRRSIGYL